MVFQFKIADMIFRFISQEKKDIYSEEYLLPFRSADRNTLIIVEVHNDWKLSEKYSKNLTFLGQNFLHDFYRGKSYLVCTLREDEKEDATLTAYDSEYNYFICVLNESDYYPEPRPISWIFRALPLNDILQHYGRTLFHCSEILFREKGILFAGPSGAGKSTQANLWKRFRQAEVICNDRAVLSFISDESETVDKTGTNAFIEGDFTNDKDGKGFWKVYSFPLDGSAPVRSNKVCRLGAVVLITQGAEDVVLPVSPAKKIALLMRQCVIEAWSAEANTKALEAMTKLLETVPIYYYSCTATDRAVDNLEKILINDGVFQ